MQIRSFGLFAAKLSIVLMLAFGCPAILHASDSGMPTIKNPTDSMQVRIPGMQRFSEPSLCDGKMCNNWIWEYIAGLYNYAAAVVGIIATVAMMFGGLLWLTAAGNATRISEAKAWIGASITGLILMLASYTVLQQINPAIISGGALKIAYIEKVPDREPESTEGNPTDSRECLNCVKIPSNRVKPGQGDLLASALATKLNLLNTNGQGWVITEGYPPKSEHKSKCHYNGTCADLAIRPLPPTCEQVTKMASTLNNAGFKVLNEYVGCGGVQTTYATGGHFHIQ